MHDHRAVEMSQKGVAKTSIRKAYASRKSNSTVGKVLSVHDEFEDDIDDDLVLLRPVSDLQACMNK
jgi:hypothetical protein